MRDDEILSAGLPHDPRIGAIRVEVAADLLPQMPERRDGSGEVETREAGVTQNDVGHGSAVAGEQIDHPGRKPGRLEHAHRPVGGQGLRG